MCIRDRDYLEHLRLRARAQEMHVISQVQLVDHGAQLRRNFAISDDVALKPLAVLLKNPARFNQRCEPLLLYKSSHADNAPRPLGRREEAKSVQIDPVVNALYAFGGRPKTLFQKLAVVITHRDDRGGI